MKPKEILMVIAIAMLTALFIGLAFDLISPQPEYEDFCEEDLRAKPLRAEWSEQCAEIMKADESQVQACQREKGMPRYTTEEGCEVYESCDYCMKEYNHAKETYERNLFFIISPIAVFFVIVGVFYTFELVASSLMFAGILLLFYSTIRYFEDMSKLTRVIVIFLELLLLLFITFKKMRKKK